MKIEHILCFLYITNSHHTDYGWTITFYTGITEFNVYWEEGKELHIHIVNIIIVVWWRKHWLKALALLNKLKRASIHLTDLVYIILVYIYCITHIHNNSMPVARSLYSKRYAFSYSGIHLVPQTKSYRTDRDKLHFIPYCMYVHFICTLCTCRRILGCNVLCIFYMISRHG